MKKIKLSKKIYNQKGVSAVITLLITAVVLTISLSIAALMLSEIKMVGSYDNSVIAYYAADAGIEDALLTATTGDVPIPYPPHTGLPKFTIDKIVGNNNAHGILSQDQSAEVDIPPSDQSNTINIVWADTGTGPGPTGKSSCAVEWTLITYQVDSTTGAVSLPENINGSGNAGIDKGYYNGNGNPSGYSDSRTDKPLGTFVYFAVCPGCTGITLPPDNPLPKLTIKLKDSTKKYAYKLRFKCLANTQSGYNDRDNIYSLSYIITINGNGQINSNAMTIGSTGTGNNVQRKVTVDINNPKKLGGIFDYVLYSEDEVYKPF